jgi:hypothetical protein
VVLIKFAHSAKARMSLLREREREREIYKRQGGNVELQNKNP